MKLRIFRTYTWELACSRTEVRFGGPNPMKLVAHDTLQFNNCVGCYESDWENVEIVEGTKPPHPDEHERLPQAVLESIDKIKRSVLK